MIVQYGTSSLNVDIDENQSLTHLVSVLHERTSVPPENMKLIARGKVIYPNAEERNISDLPLGSNTKLLMLGNVSYDEEPKELPRIRDDLTAEGRARRGKYVVDAKVLNSRGTSIQTNYRFHSIRTLPNLPEEYKAREILSLLASDPGILAVLAKHKWSVGALCELYPEGYVGVSDVCVMGLNENHGQRILLRLRTDDLKGFRKPLSIRKVLFHELAHNEHSEHDDQFYMLMRQIEREAKDMDWRLSSGFTIGSKRSLFSREADEGGAGTREVHTLGGEGVSSAVLPAPLMAAAAALSRLEAPLQATSPSPAATGGEAEVPEEEVCCGCSGRFAQQQYMRSEEVEVVSSPADQELPQEAVDGSVDVGNSRAAEGDGAVGGMETSGLLVDIDQAEGRECTEAMEAVDASIADAYNYLLDGMSGGEGPTAHLEERLPQLREALQSVCVREGATGEGLTDTLGLLRDIMARAMADPMSTAAADIQKYRRIRMNSKTFQRKILAAGAVPVLSAAGFEQTGGRDAVNDACMELIRCDKMVLHVVHSVLESVMRAIASPVSLIISPS